MDDGGGYLPTVSGSQSEVGAESGVLGVGSSSGGALGSQGAPGILANQELWFNLVLEVCHENSRRIPKNLLVSITV